MTETEFTSTLQNSFPELKLLGDFEIDDHFSQVRDKILELPLELQLPFRI